MSATLGTAKTEWTRFFRDRVAMFSTLLFPVLIIVLIGMSFGSATPTLGLGLLTQGRSDTSEAFVKALRDSPALTVIAYDDLTDMQRDIRMGLVEGGVVVPVDPADVQVYVEQAATDAGALMSAVNAAASEVSTERAAVGVLSAVVPQSRAETLVGEAMQAVPPIEVAARSVGEAQQADTNPYTSAVPSQMTLFIFLNGLLGAAALVQGRRLGIFRRAMAAPHGIRTYLAGLGLSRVAIAGLQAALLVVLGVLWFHIDFGRPVAVLVLVTLWCVVGAGAGMLLGALARNEQQAVAIAVPVGIVLGMLGGCMWPLSVVGPVMNRIGHLTPQAWAMDAWNDLIAGRGLGAIATEVVVLTAFAMAFWVLALYGLSRRARTGD